MSKKQYQELDLAVVSFVQEDVLTASNETEATWKNGWNDVWGDTWSNVLS